MIRKRFLAAALATLLAVAVPTLLSAQSQGAMNAQAAKDFQAADAKLNQVYKRLNAKLDRQSQVKLQQAQRAWLVFRDTQADFHSDAMARGGTMAPLDEEETRITLTKTRTSELSQILKELQER